MAAKTTTQDLPETLLPAALAYLRAKEEKDAMEAFMAKNRPTLKEALGFGVFTGPGVKVSVSPVFPKPTKALDLVALAAYLKARGGNLADFYETIPAKPPTFRFEVEAVGVHDGLLPMLESGAIDA